jgi:hypothetical protein
MESSNALEQSVASTDGVNWVKQEDLSFEIESIAYGNGRFVAVGLDGSVLTSADGVNWISGFFCQPCGFDWHLPMAYGNGHFVALGNEIGFTSSDGLNWVKQPIAAWLVQ